MNPATGIRRPRTGVLAATLLTAAALCAAPAAATPPPSAPSSPASSSVVLWPAPRDTEAAVHRAGLTMLGKEGVAMHIHSHLDVRVDGRPVTVPAYVGIDRRRKLYSPLHTHDTSGVVHVESPRRATFTLGQFMTEWGVPIGAHRLGPLRAGGRTGKTMRVRVDGHRWTGDPSRIRLRDHREIGISYGAAGRPADLPASYHWPAGK